MRIDYEDEIMEDEEDDETDEIDNEKETVSL